MNNYYHHPLRSTWQKMILRCYDPRSHQYKNYGARGITVCDRWRTSFEAFALDMGKRPAGLTLDRINNDGNYEPSNCRWADRITQNTNTRLARRVTWNGKTQSIAQWARDLGMRSGTLWNRLESMSVEDAMTKPVEKQPGRRKWTPSEIAIASSLRAAGESLRDIAMILGAGKDVVLKLLKRVAPATTKEPT